MTQKDIHNILVKLDMKYKAELLEKFEFDIEKIKEFETMVANECNASTETVCTALEYMNKEI